VLPFDSAGGVASTGGVEIEGALEAVGGDDVLGVAAAVVVGDGDDDVAVVGGAAPAVGCLSLESCFAAPTPITTTRSVARIATLTLARRGQWVSRSATSGLAGDAVVVPVQLGAVARLPS